MDTVGVWERGENRRMTVIRFVVPNVTISVSVLLPDSDQVRTTLTAVFGFNLYLSPPPPPIAPPFVPGSSVLTGKAMGLEATHWPFLHCIFREN